MRGRLMPIVALALLLGTVVFLGTGCNQLRARDQLNKGVQSFKNSQFPQAVEHFKTAVELDPNFAAARLYLATAYMQQYIPGAESEENTRMAKAAEDEFMNVLKQDPKNELAIESIAMLKLNQKKWDEAKQWFQKLIAVNPSKATAYYSLGFIVWSQWYPALGTARANLGMKPEDPGPIKDKKVKEQLKDKYLPMVNEGIANLQKALDIDKEYDDAMAYMNLLYRERADLADNKEQYENDVKTADDWLNKTLATKKAKAEKKGGGGITAQ